MSRTPLLTTLLWTSVGLTAACGDEGTPIIDGREPDGMVDAFVGPLAQFPASLALTAACGEPLPATVDLTVMNVGTTELVVSGATATGGFAVTSTFPVRIAPGASAAIAVRPPAAVVGTDVGGATKVGVLSLNTNQPGTTGTVALTSVVQGANLSFRDGVGQPLATAELTTSDGSCPPPLTVGVRNTGNVAVTIGQALASGGLFSASSFAPSGEAMPGGTVTHTLGVVTFGACTGSDTFQYTVTGTVCTVTPLALQANLNITGTSSCVCS